MPWPDSAVAGGALSVRTAGIGIFCLGSRAAWCGVERLELNHAPKPPWIRGTVDKILKSLRGRGSLRGQFSVVIEVVAVQFSRASARALA